MSTTLPGKTQWARPDYKLPIPSLQFVFHLECELEGLLKIGQGPNGNRMSAIMKSGRFEGPKIRGIVM